MNAQLLLEKLDIAEQALSAFPAQAAFWAARIAELLSLLEAQPTDPGDRAIRALQAWALAQAISNAFPEVSP